MLQPLAFAIPWVLLAVGGGAVAMAFANRRLDSAAVRGRWIKFGVYLLVITIESLLAASGQLIWLVLPVLALGGREFQAALAVWPPPALGGIQRFALYLMALIAAAGLLGFSLLLPAAVQLLVVLEVLVFDGFCQVSGQLLGRHRLVPRLSPAKTWEGLAGGTAACLLLASLLRPLLAPFPSSGLVLVLGGCTAVLALSGDLAASALKRRCGLKDFSRLIPGHGGVLDRFDSLLVVACGWCVLAAIGLVPFGLPSRS